MNIRRRHVLQLAAGALLTTACGNVSTGSNQPTSSQEPLRVGFVYISSIGDFGWTWSHEQGRLAIQKGYKNSFTVYHENVPEQPADAERAIRDLARKGSKVIFTTSFGYMEPTLTVAKEFPTTTFVHISGFKTAANVGTGFGKIEEPRYVSGMVAGRMTTSNQIGYVAAFPIPEVLRGINAFTLGARKVNPAAKVKVTWTNTWFNEQDEQAAAEALLNGGADVIAQHQDTLGPQRAAEARGKWSVGYNSDMGPYVPKAVLTSPVWNWGVFYTDTVKQVAAKTWKSGQYWGGWQDGVVDLAPFGQMVPADVRQQAEAEIARFKKGEQNLFTIFTGPLKDNQGTVKVAAGKAMTAEELLGMDWLVEGVDGKVVK